MVRIDKIKRLYSRNVTKLQFYYDRLIAPPIIRYISPYAVDQLYQIAKSDMTVVDKRRCQKEWMSQFGFKMMTSGTNRTVFRHLDDQKVLAKLALDNVGLRDSPRELYNQRLLRPFCTKTFEVTPNAVMGLYERVIPIVNLEEFYSMSGDIFDLLYNLIGKVVIQDIGTEYFMNWGIREGFGPCILDYPDIYELDGAKIYCGKVDQMTGVVCDGQIDYDAGFNLLYCTKCGKHFNARDLAQMEERHEIIKKGKFYNMNVEIVVNGKKVSMDDGLQRSKVYQPKSVRNYQKAQAKQDINVETGNVPVNNFFRTNMSESMADKEIPMSIVVHEDVPEKREQKKYDDRQKKLKKDLAKVQKKQQMNARSMLHGRQYAPNGIVVPVEAEANDKRPERVVIEIGGTHTFYKTGEDAEINFKTTPYTSPVVDELAEKYMAGLVEPSEHDGYDEGEPGPEDNIPSIPAGTDFSQFMNPPIETESSEHDGYDEGVPTPEDNNPSIPEGASFSQFMNPPEVLEYVDPENVHTSEGTVHQDYTIKEEFIYHQEKPDFSKTPVRYAEMKTVGIDLHVPTDDEIAAQMREDAGLSPIPENFFSIDKKPWTPPVTTNVDEPVKRAKRRGESRKLTKQEIEESMEYTDSSEPVRPMIGEETNSSDEPDLVTAYEDPSTDGMSVMAQAMQQGNIINNGLNASLPHGQQSFKGSGKKNKKKAKMNRKG